jgi:hypothetical protein
VKKTRCCPTLVGSLFWRFTLYYSSIGFWHLVYRIIAVAGRLFIG